jgi:hypothetical protein
MRRSRIAPAAQQKRPVLPKIVGHFCRAAALAGLVLVTPDFGYAADCQGMLLTGVGGVTKSWRLRDGALAAFAKMNSNIDGYAKAYHPKNFDGAR